MIVLCVMYLYPQQGLTKLLKYYPVLKKSVADISENLIHHRTI